MRSPAQGRRLYRDTARIRLASQEGMDNSIIKRLRAENNTNPRDSLGWIFRQILISRSQRDQNRWKSVLSEHDKRCLAYVASGILSDEFRALLRIPGLWHQLPFGNMHKIQAMKCFEESSHYLTQILSIFTGFVRGNTQLLESIDNYTVAALEGKCPGLFKHERRQLEPLLESGKLLPGASFEQRQLFFDAVCEFKRQIPSLSTFFRDMSYLEGCARYIKELVKVERDSTVRQSLRDIFQGDENSDCVIQSSDTNFHNLRVSAVEEQFDIAQRQLWLCAMRKSLASPVGPQTALLAKSKRPSEDPVSLIQLALVSQKLGFHSSQIDQLASGDLHKEIATETLLRIQQQLNHTDGRDSFQPALKTIVNLVQEKTSLKEIEGNGDESHVQDVEAAIRVLMSDWHPYDAFTQSGLSIYECFDSAISNDGKILMRRVY
ncbi:hypothetical protein OOU_Y34scaffold00708g1 [Pyricularia oryzae Y34]|uniref:Uncharacterized protein n=1 Tax=Pyricularia oryzae (strain Y34) TaxID=1143189 RepID=A0AA97PI22_PYRO3|nr:hypothetical protein OOU_Y34scaffold00708g1 [Pyricularia oryzae Y34]